MAGELIREFVKRVNPLRITGTSLPPNLLLVAKLLIFLLFIKDYVARLPDTWLPMWPVFDSFPPGVVALGLKTIFTVGAVAVFTNHFVRTGSLLCGIVFLLEPLVTRVGFFYANVFCGFILVLIGLYRGRMSMRFLYAQFAVMYFGSGLNKLLDIDWRTGHFMDYWLSNMVGSARYAEIASWLPEGWFAFALGWGSIIAELSLAVLFLMPRRHHVAVWGAILFHMSSMLLVRDEFGIFITALLASFLVFASWPAPGEVTVRYARSSVIARIPFFLSRWLHFDDLFRWRTVPGKWFDDAGRRRLFKLEVAERRYEGVAAFNMWLCFHPVLYFSFAVLISTKLIPWQIRKETIEFLFVFGVIWFFPLTSQLIEKLHLSFARLRGMGEQGGGELNLS